MRNLTAIRRGVVVLFVLPLMLAATGCKSSPKNDTQRDEFRSDTQAMAQDTLERLYKVQPLAKDAIKKATGYAVFSNFGMKILVAGGGSGEGVAVNNRTGDTTYMKMVELQAGLGMGAKKFKLVWVFEDAKSLDQFVNSGWTLGGQATAAAKTGDQGGSLAGAVAVAPGVWVYQMTDAGLALELTAKGTKYYKDDALN